MVFRSGDHILGTFSNGRLDGLVQETLEFCDLHNVRRDVFYKDQSLKQRIAKVSIESFS